MSLQYSMTRMELGEKKTFENLAWVQCEHLACQKWRRISAKEAASLTLHRSWYCHMNGDIARRSCEDPEESFPSSEELNHHRLKVVFSQNYPMGSLVWAKTKGYPRWPAVVCPDPNNCEVMLKNKNDVSYHVEYLGQPRTRTWVTMENIEPYSQFENVAPKAKNNSWLKNALKEANDMISYSCEARLRLCIFPGLNVSIVGEKTLQDPHELLMEKESLEEITIENNKCDSEPYTETSISDATARLFNVCNEEDRRLAPLTISEARSQNAENSPEELVRAKAKHSDDFAETLYASLADEYKEMENMLKETAVCLQDDD